MGGTGWRGADVRPSVFVSHSSGEDDSAKRLVEELVDGVGGLGFRCFLDQEELRTGDDWEARVLDELMSCQAAVLVLSESALQSNWVLREATTLLNRLAEEEDFVFHPILMPGLSRDELDDSKFSALHLDKFQLGRRPSNAVPDFVTALAPLAMRYNVDRPLHRIEANISNVLRDQLGEGACRLMADELGLDLRKSPARAWPWLIARALLTADVTSTTRSLGVVATALARQLGSVADLVFPFVGIPEQAAVELSNVARVLPPGRPLAVTRGAKPLTGKWYVQRAFYPVMPPRVVVAPTRWEPGSGGSDVIAQICGSVLEELGFTARETPDEHNVGDAFEDYEADRGHPLTVVLTQECDRAVAEQLRVTFPRACFLLFTRVDPSDVDIANVRVLTPLLDLRVERQLHRNLRDLKAG